MALKPTSVVSGGSAKITWSSLNTSACTATGGWSGAKPISGNTMTGPLTMTTVYTLICSGSGGSISRSVTVTVTAPPVPTLTLSASPPSVMEGGSSTLSWSATDVTSCTASGDWGGDKAASGSESVGPLAAATSYTLECSGAGGTVSRSVSVAITAPPVPTLRLSASPSSVVEGGSSTLNWSSTDATSCTASGDWGGDKATSGSESVGPLAAATSYTLECSGAGGTVSRSVNVAIKAPPVPTVTLSASPLSVVEGGTSTLSWSSTDATSCAALDGWSGEQPTSGTWSTAALSGTTSFTLNCTGPGGTAWDSVIVTAVPKAGSITRKEAVRFLNQASFGPTESSIAELLSLGDPNTAFAQWIDGQLRLQPSLQLPATKAALLRDPNNPPQAFKFRRSKWFDNAINGPDQLRQRVTFALSEIFVVSEYGPLRRMPLAVASYNDTLAQLAFGNFRDLLEAVTLHPAMGVYLSMLGNQKEDTTLNIRADENYAREVMQLFTIGLVQLNLDGTEKLDAQGQPIPTYDQAVVENFARVLTGWNYAGAAIFQQARRTNDTEVVPMQAYPEQHDMGSKRLLEYPGATMSFLPAGQSPRTDLENALDNIFNHPNVGPFVSKQLIMRLVASNPSPGYVARVAAKFNDDGSGRRGNLAEVVRAILLDPEARRALVADSDGKLKEPLLRVTQFLRAYEAKAANGEYRYDTIDQITGQGPLQSPSVFNFFSPAYAPPGAIADRGLVAPELEITTEFRATTLANYLYDQVFLYSTSNNVTNQGTVVIDIRNEVALAGDANALASQLADKLLGGHMSERLRTEVIAAVNRIPASKPADRAREALWLVLMSPEFAVLR